MKVKFFLLTVVITLFLSVPGRSQTSWHYSSTEIDFNSSDGDTSYYGEADTTIKTQSIWRIRRSNILYDYYPSGYLQAISTVKNSGPYAYIIDQHNLEPRGMIFRYNGQSKVYFDSSRIIAARGSFKNGELSGNWKFYNKQGRVIQVSYPVLFYNRSNYYDSLGNLVKQIDRVEGPDSVTTFKEVEFKNGQVKVISNKGLWGAFVIHFTTVFMIIILAAFFIRVFINHLIYIEEGGDVPLMWFFGSKYTFSNEIPWHWFAMCYLFWWKNYEPKNRVLVIITKVLTIIFTVTLLAFAITTAVI